MADVTYAYCAVTDVEEYTNVSAYGTTTKPSKADVESFCVARSAVVYGWIRSVTGDSAPGPDSYATTIDTSSDAGLALAEAARYASSYGAAIDALEAAGIGDDPERSDRVERMKEQFDRKIADEPSPLELAVLNAARQYKGMAHRSDVFSPTETVVLEMEKDTRY